MDNRDSRDSSDGGELVVKHISTYREEVEELLQLMTAAEVSRRISQRECNAMMRCG